MSRSLTSLVLLMVAASCSLAQTPPSNKPNLNGTWEISALIDDGKLVSPQQINDQFVQHRRITIDGQTLSVLMPGATEPKVMVYVADFAKSPVTFDLAGAEKTGSKGILLVSGDTLMICLGDPQNPERPTGFVSTPKSKTLLLTLQRAKPAESFKPVAQQPTEKPQQPAAKPTAPAALSESQTRQMLVGTWGHQTKDSIDYITLNADGTMSVLRNWKSSFKQTFSGPERTSGTWKLEGGVVVFYVTTSTEKERRNQVYSFYLRNLTANEIIYVDQSGQVRREWKVLR